MLHKLSTAARVSLLFLVFSHVVSAQITFVRHDISRSLGGPYGLHVVDMNHDGKLDILTASTSDGVHWWRNNGNGTFEENYIGDLAGAWYVHGSDVDGDGDIDVMAASPDSLADQIKLWVNGGSFNWSETHSFPLIEAEAVEAADFTGSGAKEIVGTSWGRRLTDPGSDLVYFQNYLGNTYGSVMIDPDLLGAHDVTTADLDEDNDIDIAASGSSVINFYFNDGNGFFSRRTVVYGEGALGFRLADVDRDGDLDIVAHARNSQGVCWYENTPGFNFIQHLVDDNIGECWSVHAADLDADGDIDMTAGSIPLNTVRAYINDGLQNFTKVVVANNFPYCRFEYPADFDGDGDADIAAVSTTTNTLAWFESVAPPPSIQLTSPNGGESWEAGSVHNITWTSKINLNNVKLEFSSNGGATWSTIIASTPNNGNYNWIVPNSVSNTCRVRVSDAADGIPADVSNAPFSVIPPATPTITILAPNGGEVLLGGTSYNIQWNSTGGISYVKTQYSTDGGTSWKTIRSSTLNDGLSVWTVPVEASQNCLIRISDAADGDPFDVSDQTFTIIDPVTAAFALSFDGVDDMAWIPDNPTLSGGPGKSLTVEAWVKLASVANDRPIITKILDGNWKDWGLIVEDGMLLVTIENNGDNWAYSAGTISAGVWTHVAFTFDNAGNMVRLYLNGSEVGAGMSLINDMPDTQASIFLGKHPYNGDHSAGVLDEVRIWNYARSASQLQENKNKVLQGNETGLIGYWRFDEGGGQLSTDISGKGNPVQLGETEASETSDPAWVASEINPPATILTFTFSPTADAFVRSSAPTSNFGTSVELRLRKTSSVEITSYLKFDVTGLQGNLQSAKLRIYLTNGSNDRGSVYVVSNNYNGNTTPWTEKGLKWNNAPPIAGTALGKIRGVTVGSRAELDVTSAITGNGTYSFGLKNNSSDLAAYSSKEGSFAPELVIKTAASPASIAKPVEAVESDWNLLATPMPERLTLYPNHPNPLRASAFNAQTTIEYDLPAAANVRLVIFDLAGRQVRTLVDGAEQPGYKRVVWDGKDARDKVVSSGIYLYRLEVGNEMFVKKMTVVK